MCKQSHNTRSKFTHNTVKVVGENFPSTQNRPSGIYVDGICIQFIYKNFRFNTYRSLKNCRTHVTLQQHPFLKNAFLKGYFSS